jgi:transposase
VARIVEAVVRYGAGKLTCEEAGRLLGMSERHFRRLRDRYEAEGAEGLADRRVGRVSARRAAVDEVVRVLGLFETHDWDFRVKPFHEVLEREHGIGRSYSWVKNTLQAAGKVVKAPKRSAHRRKRVRRPQEGMMLFQDGSRFDWIPGFGQQLDLVVTIGRQQAGRSDPQRGRRQKPAEGTTPRASSARRSWSKKRVRPAAFSACSR